MRKKDWTLLAIAAAKGKPLSPVQLQKSLFLLRQEFKKAVGRDFYEFVPYNYGPFNATIYNDAEELETEQLITILRAPGQNWPEYRVTSSGMKEARKIKKRAPTKAVKYLNNVVVWVRSLSFAALVRTIYHHFPKYRQNSVFQY